MPYLDLPSHRLQCRIDGSEGPWLVFCNSLAPDLTIWDAQVVDFGNRFRILRHDRRGHGASGTPPPPYSLDDLGSDVLALMDALHIGRAHFCGLSIGGLIGQWLALNAPERFDRMVFDAGKESRSPDAIPRPDYASSCIWAEFRFHCRNFHSRCRGVYSKSLETMTRRSLSRPSRMQAFRFVRNLAAATGPSPGP